MIHHGMPCDPVQGQGHKPSELEIRLFSKSVSSIIYNVSCQVTTNS